MVVVSFFDQDEQRWARKTMPWRDLHEMQPEEVRGSVE